MATRLESLLAERSWLMADGATGTNLFNMGLEAGEAPEMWNVSEPAKVRALYDGAVGAGSDIFLTNSFGGNASRLKLHEAEGRVFELNRIAAEMPATPRTPPGGRWWWRARWGRRARSWRRSGR